MRARTLCGSLWVGVALLSGCSIEKMAADNMVPVFVKIKNEFNKETVTQYAREAGPALLAQLNGFVLASPANPEFRLLQAEMNATFAFAFLEVENPAWATDHYRKAQAAALIALADVDEDLAEGLTTLSLDALDTFLADQDQDAVPALFWWGFARGAQVNLHRNDPKLILDLDRVDKILTWVLEQDETFFNAGPHLFFALRHTMLPATLGGKPEIGLKHFQEVARITKNKMLLPMVFQAQYFAPGLAATPAGATLDEIKAAHLEAWKAFYDPLVAVLEAPDDLWPEQALSNAVAKDRALALLEDPESNNIIPPLGVKNPYQASGEDDGGDWGDGSEGSSGDDEGDWGE